MQKKTLYWGLLFALITSEAAAHVAEAGFVPTLYKQTSEFAQSSLDVHKLNIDTDKVPPTKMPSISMNVSPLLHSLLERVWLTKYSGESSEILKSSSEMPFCEALPDSPEKQEGANGAFLWVHPCLPIE